MTTPRKRSASLQLTTMLAGAASLTLAGCDDGAPSHVQWDKPRGEQIEAFSYKTLAECKAANEVSDAQCDTSYAAAQTDDNKNAPRYDQRATCEDVYGVGNCVPRGSNNGGGGSFFTPLLTGFVIGQMLDGGYRGTGLYRRDDRYGGGYYSPWGGQLDRDYRTGRTVISRDSIDPPDAIRQAPPRVQTRTSVVSRGGFGGSRSYSSGSSSFRGGFGG